MSARRRHPSLEDWKLWIASGEQAGSLHDHHSTCTACRALVDTLRTVRRVRATGTWTTPPDHLTASAVAVAGRRRPPRPSRSVPLSCLPVDVRGDAVVMADDARIVAGSCEEGEVSVLVRPPLEDANWSFEARVWCSDTGQGGAHGDPGATITVVLVHDDHVIRSVEVADGARARVEDVVPGRWRLEIHMPGGTTLVLDDPFAGE